MPLTNVAVEMDFGSGWEDVSTSVRVARQPIVIDRGFPGSGPLDNVARTPTCTFTLDNTGLDWSPGGPSCKTGFGLLTPVRVRRTIDTGGGAATTTRFHGYIASIQVEPGIARGRNVWVRCTGWTDAAAMTTMRDCSFAIRGIYANRRADQLLFGFTIGPTYQGIVDLVPVAHLGTSAEPGAGIYPVALDDLTAESYILEAIARIVASEGGQFFEAADGTLTFHNRHHRMLAATSVTLDNTMREIGVEYDTGGVINLVRVTTTPRLISTDTDSVIASITPEVPWTIPVDDGASGDGTLVLRAEFEDADGNAIGAVDIQDPADGTDYLINSRPDGTGFNLGSPYCSVTKAATISGVTWTITNTTGSTNPAPIASGGTGACVAYLRFIQARGRMIEQQDPVESSSTDATSEAAYGQRILGMTLPYETDPNVGSAMAEWQIRQLKDPAYRVSRLAFRADISDALLTVASADLNARIALDETVSGLSSDAPTTGSFESTAFESTAFDIAVASPWLTAYHITGIRETYPNHLTQYIEWQVGRTLTRADWIRFDDATYGIFDGDGVMGYM